jgi:transposase
MNKRLTAQERADLIIQHKSERDKRICDRIKAVLLYDKGYSYTKIAEILLLDDETIRRHVSRISLKESKLLKAHLREKTYLYVKKICAYVQSEFNLTYTRSNLFFRCITSSASNKIGLWLDSKRRSKTRANDCLSKTSEFNCWNQFS